MKISEIKELPNGTQLYRHKNEAGGYTYLSDEVGAGYVIYDSALTDIETIEECLKWHKELNKKCE